MNEPNKSNDPKTTTAHTTTSQATPSAPTQTRKAEQPIPTKEESINGMFQEILKLFLSGKPVSGASISNIIVENRMSLSQSQMSVQEFKNIARRRGNELKMYCEDTYNRIVEATAFDKTE